MKLPIDEEDNEEVVGVPEPLEMGAASLLNSKEDHDAKGSGHDPASDTRACDKVGLEECNNALTSGLCVRVGHGKLIEVNHVRKNMDNGPSDD